MDRVHTFTSVGYARPLAGRGAVRLTGIVRQLIASSAHVTGAAGEIRVLTDDCDGRWGELGPNHCGGSGGVAVVQDSL